MTVIYTDPNGEQIDEYGEVVKAEENLSPEQWEVAEKLKESDGRAADLRVRN